MSPGAHRTPHFDDLHAMCPKLTSTCLLVPTHAHLQVERLFLLPPSWQKTCRLLRNPGSILAPQFLPVTSNLSPRAGGSTCHVALLPPLLSISTNSPCLAASLHLALASLSLVLTCASALPSVCFLSDEEERFQNTILATLIR